MSENMCGSETFDGIPEVPDEVGGMVERAGGIDKIVRGLPSEDVLTEKCQIFAALSSSVRLRIMYILAGADLCPSGCPNPGYPTIWIFLKGPDWSNTGPGGDGGYTP